jgi:hypothetical protein
MDNTAERIMNSAARVGRKDISADHHSVPITEAALDRTEDKDTTGEEVAPVVEGNIVVTVKVQMCITPMAMNTILNFMIMACKMLLMWKMFVLKMKT